MRWLSQQPAHLALSAGTIMLSVEWGGRCVGWVGGRGGNLLPFPGWGTWHASSTERGPCGRRFVLWCLPTTAARLDAWSLGHRRFVAASFR